MYLISTNETCEICAEKSLTEQSAGPSIRLPSEKNLCKAFHKFFCDAKQFVGLTDYQMRDTRKLDFAFKSSFTAVNVVKIMCSEHNLSFGRLKALKINAYYAQRITDVFGLFSNMSVILWA